MSQQQIDRIRECKDGLKRVIAQIERTMGINEALPVTMPIIQAIVAAEKMLRKEEL